MGAISTSIELNDRVSGVLTSIINKTDAVMHGFDNMKSAELPNLKPPVINTSPIDNLTDSLQDASNMADALNSKSQDTNIGSIVDDSAKNEISALQARIVSLQAEINDLRLNTSTVNMKPASDSVDRLREQLVLCIQQQSTLNAEMHNASMDNVIKSVNNLNASLNDIESNIRDNIINQNQFNDSVRDGKKETSSLVDEIKKIAGVMLTVNEGKKVLSFSDDYANLKARLNMIKDEGQSVEDMLNNLYAISADSRSDVMTNGQAVYGFATAAKDAFNSTKEAYEFVNLINKTLTVGGASTVEKNSTLLQLKQGLGSGKLQGDEFRSLSENAPQILQYVADYLGKTSIEVKELASDGKLTADIIKNAVFSNIDDINKQFDQMPKTFGQIVTEIKNDAIRQFALVLDELNQIANNPDVQTGVNYLISGFGAMAKMALFAVESIAKVFKFVGDNWDVMQPIIIGLIGTKALISGIILLQKAQAAQALMTELAELGAINATNAALIAQIGLIGAKMAIAASVIVLIIGLIYGIVTAINKVTGSSIDAFGIIVGSLNWCKAEFENGFIFIADLGMGLWNVLKALGGNILNGVKNLKNDVLIIGNDLFAKLETGVLNVLKLINKIPGVNIDTSGIEEDIAGFKNAANYQRNTKREYQSLSDAFITGFGNIELKDASKAFDDGYNAGSKFKDKLKNYGKGEDYSSVLKELDDIAKSSNATAANTDATKKALTKTDIQYLGDMFKAFADKNRTNVYVNQGITNTTGTDYDGMSSMLGRGIKKAVSKALK